MNALEPFAWDGRDPEEEAQRYQTGLTDREGEEYLDCRFCGETIFPNLNWLRVRRYVAWVNGNPEDLFDVYYLKGRWRAWTGDTIYPDRKAKRELFAGTLVGIEAKRRWPYAAAND